MGKGRRTEKEKTCDMKTRKIIVEVICFLLMMFWFYEGIYKIANFRRFELWLQNAPFLALAWRILEWGIPIVEITIAVFFLANKYRSKILYITILANLIFILWAMSFHLFTNRLFWPYHGLGRNPMWRQKMAISIGICWIAFIAIILLKNKRTENIVHSKSLRNTSSANAS